QEDRVSSSGGALFSQQWRNGGRTDAEDLRRACMRYDFILQGATHDIEQSLPQSVPTNDVICRSGFIIRVACFFVPQFLLAPALDEHGEELRRHLAINPTILRQP